ncbi:MAG: hypothetical protein KatS3mg044_1425 [Rhodothermaceae bacterium]|nr:MAG: MmcQ/YjbR family DNA-binding protein [Bacteroidota bacterium]GIV62559.1 MAG: hypothetical protein KatS3mg044_1425 [Rhodothermaceae bacterium]
MDIETLYHVCRDRPGVTEETPFGEDVLVFKVMGKMFALMNVEEHPLRVNLKCDPARALELRATYAAIRPGYHMNKRHWNTVVLDGSLPDALVKDLVDHSYELVVRGLSRRDREGLGAL